MRKGTVHTTTFCLGLEYVKAQHFTVIAVSALRLTDFLSREKKTNINHITKNMPNN